MHYKIVIIAAGGTGSRLNINLPKQYMLLCNKPVLMHTIEAFSEIAEKIIIAIHPNMVSYWKDLCEKYKFKIKHDLAIGGDTRFQSIQNALNYIEANSIIKDYNNTSIAVHDGARPLVDKNLINKSFELAQSGISCTLAIKSTNSIRIGNQYDSKSIDREIIWQIQTPQTFPAKILQEAYCQKESPLFTDDCSVVENLGHSIQLIDSTNKNIKLTFPEDFKIAESYINC